MCSRETSRFYAFSYWLASMLMLPVVVPVVQASFSGMIIEAIERRHAAM